MFSNYYNFYGCKVVVCSESFSSADMHSLQEFSFFQSQPFLDQPYCQIQLESDPSSTVQGIPIFKTKMGVLSYVNFFERQMTYTIDGKIVANVWDKEKNRKRFIKICGKNPITLNEILYYVLMSVCGEQLDLNGYMRLHAASFWKNGFCTVVWGKPKSGKSTLTQAFLNDDLTKIYSDETTLFQLGAKKIVPFPNLISISHTQTKSQTNFFPQKVKIAISEKKIAPEKKITSIYWLQKKKQNQTKKMSFLKRCLFYWNIFFGVGLIQMSEFLIRPTNIKSLIRIAYHRIILIVQLWSIPTFEQFRNHDMEENIPLLKNAVFLGKPNN